MLSIKNIKKEDDRKFYKVLFKGFLDSEENILNLTFEVLSLKEPVKIEPAFINKIKELTIKRENIFFFQNIKEVLQLGKDFQFNNCPYYYIFLYTLKSNSMRKGILIGNVKSIGDVIIGIWPIEFNLKKSFDLNQLLSEINHIINNPDDFINITLIN